MKEKIGVLRAYADIETVPSEVLDQTRTILWEGHHESAFTRKHCAAAGRFREERTWVRTLCNQCDAQAEDSGGG